jgi:hypothetical protein
MNTFIFFLFSHQVTSRNHGGNSGSSSGGGGGGSGGGGSGDTFSGGEAFVDDGLSPALGDTWAHSSTVSHC